MQFYKIQGEWINMPQEDKEKNFRENTRQRVKSKTVTFNEKDTDRFCFVSDISDDTVTVGVITKRICNLNDFVDSYYRFVGLQVKEEMNCEVTIMIMEDLLRSADRRDYIQDDDKIKQQFELSALTSGRHHGFLFGENILNRDLGSIGGPAAILSQESIKSIECVEYPELGMEAVWKIRVVDFPAFILVDNKGNDFFKKIGL